MIEKESAVLLATKVLDRINCDPDEDISVLARQLLRSREMQAKAEEERDYAQYAALKAQDRCANAQQYALDIQVHRGKAEAQISALQSLIAEKDTEIATLKTALNAEGHAYEDSLTREDEWEVEHDKRVGSLHEVQQARLAAEAQISALQALIAEKDEALRLGLELKLGAYPAHGSGYVAVLTGGSVSEFQDAARTALNSTEAKTGEPG